MGLGRRLWQLTRERFAPAVHLPMVAVFTLGNVAVAGAGAGFSAARFLVTTAIALLYFFRLRCFDEIKDLPHDRQHNPERPLARGLLTPRELVPVIAAALVAELALAAWLGGAAGLVALALAQGYSLLMFREFFAGAWLRPRLTTYAATHTLSAALLGAALGLLWLGEGASPWWRRELAVFLFNWCLFNLFEFGRKTWAPGEERQEVDSYSRRFGTTGAVVLAATQVAGALALLALHPRALEARWSWLVHAALLVAPAAAAVALVVRRSGAAGRLYRGAVSIYLVLFYLAAAGDLMVPGGGR